MAKKRDRYKVINLFAHPAQLSSSRLLRFLKINWLDILKSVRNGNKTSIDSASRHFYKYKVINLFAQLFLTIEVSKNQ